MTKEFWQELDKKLSFFGSSTELKCGSDIISLHLKKYKMKLVIEVYINGVIRGNEPKKNIYWCEKTKNCYDKKFVQSQTKLIKKLYKGEELKEELKPLNSKIIYYIPFFSSFTNLKHQYKARKLELEFVEKENNK